MPILRTLNTKAPEPKIYPFRVVIHDNCIACVLIVARVSQCNVSLFLAKIYDFFFNYFSLSASRVVCTRPSHISPESILVLHHRQILDDHTFGYRFLLPLVLRDQVVHHRSAIRKFGLVHSLCRVPMQVRSFLQHTVERAR